MDLFSHTIMVVVTSFVLFACLKHFNWILSVILLVLIPAIYIIYMSEPDAKQIGDGL